MTKPYDNFLEFGEDDEEGTEEEIIQENKNIKISL